MTRDTPGLDRDLSVRALADGVEVWDILIIGGGATGLGAAVDAASRGYRTLLLERDDFGKGTSSRSTKLVHGGVRYLQQGNVSLVLEALHERGLLLKNAPHLASTMAFVVPCYRWWERLFYGAGLKLYDVLSRDRSLGKSFVLSRGETEELLPTISPRGLRGGVLYHDGQFDDSRLAVNLAQTAAESGAVVVNYVRVDGLLKSGDRIRGVAATDVETGRSYEIESSVVVNATGVFADSIRGMDEPDAEPIIRPSQGIHIVLDQSFLPGKAGLMIPRTKDGRVLFAIPWHGRIVLGTTDTALDEIEAEPIAREEEIDFLLEHAGVYLKTPPARKDVLSVFAGLRPLVSSGAGQDTASISRDHVLRISRSGLVTITGGKWTTYRKMAEDTVDKAAETGGLEGRRCRTAELRIHGWTEPTADGLGFYGSDAPAVARAMRETEGGDELLHKRLPYRRGEVAWAAEAEMARTVEDVLSRRTRALLLDARASIEAAPDVALILARRLGRNGQWQEDQVRAYRELAMAYLPGPESKAKGKS